MALRIKSQWHNEVKDRSLEEIAGAIAFITWKIALDKAVNLHGENFVYESDKHIEEYKEFIGRHRRIPDFPDPDQRPVGRHDAE